MDNCPTCQKRMIQLSDLFGMSVYDMAYWCKNCGTIAYTGGSSLTISSTTLSDIMIIKIRATDDLSRIPPLDDLHVKRFGEPTEFIRYK